MTSKAQKLTGYNLTERLRKNRKRHHLTATEQALYYELVAICNEGEWEDVFECSNEDLCKALRVSENTLIAARMSLINAGLLFYSSGKSKRQHGLYSFAKKLATAKPASQKKKQTPSDFEVDASGDTEVDASANPSGDASDSIIEQTETETETENFSAAEAAELAEQERLKAEEEERKKAAAQKKKEEAEAKTPHWKAMVKVWFDFYQSKKGHAPTFNDRAGKHLKAILTLLQKGNAMAPNLIVSAWTEQQAAETFIHFLTNAYSIPWLSQNFLLSNLESKYDVIIQTKADGQQTSKTGKLADFDRELEELLANVGSGSR